MPAWPRGQQNAEGSLNLFFHTHLSAVTASWFTTWVTAPAESAHLRFDWSDQPLRPPCFTIAHLGSDPAAPGLGQQRVVSPAGMQGGYRHHLTEISVWHSRYSGGATYTAPRPNWPAELRQLRDMVAYLVHSAGSCPLLDLDSGLAAPYYTAGLLRFRDLREVVVPPDPNPAFVRQRLLLSWERLAAV